MADERITIDIDVQDGVSGPAQVIIKVIGDIGDKAEGAAPKVTRLDNAIEETGDDAKVMAAQIAILEKKIKAMGNESLKSAAKITLLEKKIAKLNRTGSKTSGGGGKKGGFFGGLIASFNPAGLVGLLKVGVILDAAGAVATLGSALGALGAGAVAGLAPLGGLLAGYPTLLAALGQGLGTVKLGFSGVADSIALLSDPEASPEELSKALDKLSPKMQTLAKEVAALKKPFDKMKKSIGNDLAPGFIRLTKSAKGYLPIVTRAFKGTANVISNAASEMANFLRLDSTKSKVSGIMQQNQGMISSLTRVGINGAKVMLNIVSAAGPMFNKLLNQFARFTDYVAKASDNPKGLAGFFEKTYKVTQKVITVVKDLTIGLFNIFKQGGQLGSDMGDVILDLARKFREFTQGADGQQKIAQWFAEMKPIIWEVGRLIGAVAKALFGLKMDKTVITTLQSLRTDALPALVSMMNAASGQFIPALSQIASSIAQIMIDLQVGPTVIKLIAGGLQVVSNIISAMPGWMKTILGYLVTMATLIKVSGFIGAFRLLGGGMAGAAAQAGFLTTALSALRTGFVGIYGAVGSVVTGGSTLRQELRMMAGSARTTGLALMTALGPVAAIAVVGGIVAAIMSGNAALKKMHEEVAAVTAELDKGINTSSLTGFTDKLSQLQADLQSYRDMYNDSNPLAHLFDTRLWTDIWKTKGNPFNYDASMGADYENQIDAMTTKLNNYYGVVQNMMNKTGNGDMDFWNRIAEGAGVNATMGINEAEKAMTGFYNANYAARPAVTDMYNALKTLGDTGATAADKVDAFTTVMTSLQTIFTKGDKVGDRINVKRQQEQVDQALKTSNLTRALTAKQNWQISEAMSQQVSYISELVAGEMKRKGPEAALNAYQKQYNILKNKIAKSLQANGMEQEKSVRRADRLIQKFMVAPKYMRNAIMNDKTLQQMIESGKYSYEQLRKYIRGHPLKPTIRIGAETKRKAKFGLRAMADISTKSKTESVAVRVTGEQKAINDIQNVGDAIAVLNATPARPTFDTESIRNGKAELVLISEQLTALSNVGVGINVDVTKNKQAREFGGPVLAGQQYLVGEAGPEAFVSRGGAFQMIGTSGREYRTFSSDGVVIPNYALPQAAPASTGGSGVYEYAQPNISVHIGTVNASSDVDIAQAVKRGIRDAQRNMKERR